MKGIKTKTIFLTQKRPITAAMVGRMSKGDLFQLHLDDLAYRKFNEKLFDLPYRGSLYKVSIKKCQ